MDNEYTYKKVEGGYRVFTPTGQPVALLACSLEAVEVISSCHKDRRMPTTDERKILFPKMSQGVASSFGGGNGGSQIRSVAVVHGNLVFVRNGKPDIGKESH